MDKNDPYHGNLVWEHLNKRCKTGCPYCRIAELEAENAKLLGLLKRWYDDIHINKDHSLWMDTEELLEVSDE